MTNTGDNKALIIGISNYVPVPGVRPLKGCVYDAQDMVHTLHVLNVIPPSPASMRIHTDGRATRKNILDSLKWLIHGAKQGDQLVFYYSGHGSQRLVLNDKDEVDGRDETILPYDHATAGDIRDDDLRSVIANLAKGARLEVIVDCCHAGSLTRSSDVDSRGQTVTYRNAEPPLEERYFLDLNASIKTTRLLRSAQLRSEVEIVPSLNHILWAACHDFQGAAEDEFDGGVFRGVFTYCLCRALRRSNGNITRQKLLGLVSADIKQMHYVQVPDLEGPAESFGDKVFS